jgi:hypothetical protein
MPKTRKNHRRHYHHEMEPSEHTTLATYHDLHIWNKHLFERLGWMVLAKEMGYKDKIQAYKTEIKRYKHALKVAQEELKEQDHQRDMHLLEEKIEILEKHVKKDFC